VAAQKDLYGLRHSPKHWYEALQTALLNVGLSPCRHDPCVFTVTLIDGEPPLYLGVYVDDFTYFSTSDAVEEAFEQALSLELKIDWMGELAWFLGKCYDWQKDANDNLTVSITQTAKIESMLDEYNLTDCNAVRSPYRSGLPIDLIARDNILPDNKPEPTSRWRPQLACH
jgi:hypothetical protein